MCALHKAEKGNPFRNIQSTKTSRNFKLPIKQQGNKIDAEERLRLKLVFDKQLYSSVFKIIFQVDCALSLVRLGMERNIPGLQVLCDNLITLETVVYETDGDRTLTLKELLEMKDIEKLRLLMKNVSILNKSISIP